MILDLVTLTVISSLDEVLNTEPVPILFSYLILTKLEAWWLKGKFCSERIIIKILPEMFLCLWLSVRVLFIVSR